jgi:hypothetical protein
MRNCSKCGPKPMAEFNWRNRKKGTRQSFCRSCQSEAKSRHYIENRDDYHSRRDERRRFLSDMVNSIKSKPCADCGLAFPPLAMDFDHLSNKSFNISRMVNNGLSEELIRAEIAKCDLVCAVCHRIRTHVRSHKCDRSKCPKLVPVMLVA